MEQVPSYIDKIMCKYSFDKTETEYIENCLLELYKTKKLIGEDIKYWIKSFTDAVHANRFYIDVICEQDLTKYYHRYYRTKKNIRPHSIIYINFGYGYPKELRYGHFAYVHKVDNGKALVIQLVSLKNNERKLRYSEEEIVIVNHGMLTPSLMRFDEMRWIDLQRINENHDVPEKIQTPRGVIIKKLRNYLELEYR